MFIDQETLFWVNTEAPYKDFSKLDTPEIRQRAGVIEIADPVPPEDYSDETYYRTETGDRMPPYVVYTKKSAEQLERLQDSKNLQAAKNHLSETDYLFNVDRHAKLLVDEPQRAADLANSRELAREVIRQYKVKYPPVVAPAPTEGEPDAGIPTNNQ